MPIFTVKFSNVPAVMLHVDAVNAEVAYAKAEAILGETIKEGMIVNAGAEDLGEWSED